MHDQSIGDNCWQIITPVCLLIFKRPEATRRVLDVIRQVRPPQLFVVADGPRANVPEEAEQCLAARAVVNEIDWECQIFKNYSDVNLGCRQRIPSGLNWVFENVESAIILEDDCLPDISFFRFCEELLARYRHDDRVMVISGDNFQFGNNRTEYSYYFSRYPHCWSWATWRRAWQRFDGEMHCWPELRDSQWLHRIFVDDDDELAAEYWTKIFQRNYDGFNSWAYAWTFTCWLHNGLTALPRTNLISNIGFGETATNTKSKAHRLSCLPVETLQFPLIHPPTISRDSNADAFTEKTIFSGTKLRSVTEPTAPLPKNSQHPARDFSIPGFKELRTRLLSIDQRLRFGYDPEIRPALAFMRTGNYAQAFTYLNQLKSQRQVIRHLDRLRAICFVRLGQESSAVQALREELRYFPDNWRAQRFLRKLVSKAVNASTEGAADAEFQVILKLVQPYTMLSPARLYSLFSLTKQACLQNVLGDVVECGVAGGGSTLLMAMTIERYTQMPRFLYACDSFEGMPEPTEKDCHGNASAISTGWGTGTCAASEEYVQQLCSKFGVENIVITVKGYFQDTLPKLRLCNGRIAFLHADSDWYESTRSIFDNLYKYVDSHGFIQVDDYGYWEGCREAIHDFELRYNLRFDIEVIDSTGVWFTKPKLDVSQIPPEPAYLNLGCGSCLHSDWINVDFKSTKREVISYDLTQGVPFPDNSFTAVYHSHLLEHLPKSAAEPFLRECYRVLQPGGILRVVVPDLEQIARLYLTALEKASQGDREWAANYDWMLLEMYDQVVRDRSGGEMVTYLSQNPLPNEAFVLGRLGAEGEQMLRKIRDRRQAAPTSSPPPPEQIAAFRQSGEVHQWMYDRHSLGILLARAGFRDLRVCSARESRIPDFERYHLDITPEGKIRKADSLFMEASK